jgi:hypothetical protein
MTMNFEEKFKFVLQAYSPPLGHLHQSFQDFGCEPLPYTGSCPRLCLAFLATMSPALDPACHLLPRAKPTCLSTPQRPRKA